MGYRRTPLYVRIADELEAAILKGVYDPGQRLPPGHALADHYGVNRHTVERALDQLQNKGLVYRVRGHGAYVSPGRLEYRVASKMSFTDSVERLGLANSQRVLGIRQVGAYGHMASELGLEGGEPVVTLERVRLAGEVPLALLVKHYPEKIFPSLHEYLSRGFLSTRKLIRDRYGHEVYRHSSVFEIEPSDEDLSRNLAVPLGSPLLKVESLDCLEDGTPAEWGIGWFRGDALRVRVKVWDRNEE
jgi:GntR family transcriptional regulator, phosphonate transport system regulatory protein